MHFSSILLFHYQCYWLPDRENNCFNKTFLIGLHGIIDCCKSLPYFKVNFTKVKIIYYYEDHMSKDTDKALVTSLTSQKPGDDQI